MTAPDAPRVLPDAWSSLEDAYERAMRDNPDPLVCWIGRAIWAGIIAAGFALGVGIYFAFGHVARMVRRG